MIRSVRSTTTKKASSLLSLMRKNTPAAIQCFSTCQNICLTPTCPPTNNSHKLFNTERGPKAIGPYSQATILNERLVFVSGQLGLDPKTGALAEGLDAQCHQALKNMSAILEDAGSSMDNVLKTTILLTDMAHFEVVNKIYESYFPNNKPARATFAVKALPKGGVVEIEAVAYQNVTPQHN